MRGRTPQELVAPKVACVLARYWTNCGAKFECADKLKRTTVVPEHVPRFDKSFADVSFFEQMR